MSSVTQPRYTAAQYLDIERKSAYKSEFVNGQIFAMAGASFTHNLIVANLAGELRNRLRGGSCRAVASDLRVQVTTTGMYTYPDVVVVCGEPRFADNHQDTLLNPTLIIEVLSPSTEAYDRGGKFAHYRRLETLTDYVLVAQDRVMVEHFVRQGEQWVLSEISDTSSVFRLISLDCELALREIYDRVEFSDTEQVSPIS